MKIVGSRTGAYEVWVRSQCGEEAWLGQRPDSDLDLVLAPDEPEPVAIDSTIRLNVWRDGFFSDCPYIDEDENLYKPKGYYYLVHTLWGRLRSPKWKSILVNPCVLDVLDKEKNKLDQIEFDLCNITDWKSGYMHTLRMAYLQNSIYFAKQKLLKLNN